MYKNIFSKQWIKSPKLISYLLTIPRMYRISMVLNCDGVDTPFPIRDEEGDMKLLTVFREHNVVSIDIEYQNLVRETVINVNRQLDEFDLPYIEKKVNAFMQKYGRETGHDLSTGQLAKMQRSFRDHVEKTIGFRIQGEEEYPDSNIAVRLSNMDENTRRRFLDYVCRLSDKSVPVVVQFLVDGSTVEEIDNANTELDMFETERIANMQINSENSEI